MFEAQRPKGEFGSSELPVRPALRHELNPNGSLTVHAPNHCPRRHPVPGSGTFSWIVALHLHSLICLRCRDEGHVDDHQWALIDPAYEQVEAGEAKGVGLELVAVPPAEDAGPGRIELRLDGHAIGTATFAVCPQDRTGVLEHVQVDAEHRGRGYGRVLALAAFSRLDWSTDGPHWVRGDRRVRALRGAQHGAGYAWTTTLIEDTPLARGFAKWLPLPTVGEPLYCRHMLAAAARLTV
ncbi:GNAT family N-acetyltransferase [Amycolatopsis sp. NPDC051903]|uniref:GNAT family N-acetyltransferase n=1 Tax=Amycolatopsis sp. NPDC051903 TaxID=3363936 RepID=UPI00378EC038